MIRPLILISCVALSAGSVAAEPEALPRPNWAPDRAIEASLQADTRDTLAHLYGLAREGRGDVLLQSVLAIDSDADRPEPERDRILFELAAALVDFEPDRVGRETLEYLRDRPVRVRVPHEENPAVGVPLFNVRSAAAGTLAEWTRLQKHAHDRVEDSIDGRFTNAESFLGFLAAGGGPAIAQQARQAEAILDAGELEVILLAAPGLADRAAASVLIGELGPGLVDRPAVTDLMFGLLGNRELGAGAALVLGRSGDPAVLSRLADLAAADRGLTTRRASLAIDIYLASEHSP